MVLTSKYNHFYGISLLFILSFLASGCSLLGQDSATTGAPATGASGGTSSSILTSDSFDGANATYNSTTGRNTDVALGGSALSYTFLGGLGFDWAVISNKLFLSALPAGNSALLVLQTGYRNCTVQVKLAALAANTKTMGIFFRDATSDSNSYYELGYYNNAFGGALNGVAVLSYDIFLAMAFYFARP